MISRLVLFFFSMLTCTVAGAVGFGHAEIKSHLGEPLAISIPLVLSDKEREDKLQVMLATPKEYQILEQNIPNSYLLLRTDMRKTDDGLWVNVSSFQAIDESFLTIILKVQRGRGNFYKRIQVLLDPAWHKSNQLVHKKAEAGGVLPVNTIPIASAPVQQVDSVQQPQAESPDARALDWARRISYGPVQSGDNLSKIAYRLRKDKRFSNRQVMLALFHANPQAFEGNDMNRLKQGASIQVPKLQDMQIFLNSTNYQALEKSLEQKKKRAQKIKTMAEPLVNQQPVQKYRSRISLGMTESLDALADPEVTIRNIAVMSRLEKLELLYDEVMASSIRMDSMDLKVHSLAEEVRSLQQKFDILSQQNAAQMNAVQKSDKKNYAWWWFFFLLMLNVLLLLFFLYRKQRKIWQDKLQKSQLKKTFTVAKPKREKLDEVMKPVYADNALTEKSPVIAVDSTSFQADLLAHPMDDEPPVIKNENTHVDHGTSFEIAVQKEDWREAEKHYQSIVRNVQNKPRIQALYVKMLHQEKRVSDRNRVLLSLYNMYGQSEWNRFCSLFDEDIWLQLQDERVISFTGDVSEKGIKHSNLAAKELDNILAFSDMDIQMTTERGFDITSDIMDETVVMHAKDLTQGDDVGIDKSKDSDLMFELDFDEALKAEDAEAEKTVFTEIDVDFTDGNEAPAEDKKK